MNQREQVVAVMEELDGFATLQQLNQKVDVSGWRAQDPFANIRRIVQDTNYFFKIKPGLWALNAYRAELDDILAPKDSPKEQNDRNHYYYQGLLLEIGNVKSHDTFVPHQDKNKPFLRTTLGQTRTLDDIHPFGYKKIVKRARSIDVLWFNQRQMPYAAFEVEHSTDFAGALSRYIELQDFNTQFYVVADGVRERQFKERIARDEYRPLRARVKFLDYEKLANWHAQSIRADEFKEMP